MTARCRPHGELAWFLDGQQTDTVDTGGVIVAGQAGPGQLSGRFRHSVGGSCGSGVGRIRGGSLVPVEPFIGPR